MKHSQLFSFLWDRRNSSVNLDLFPVRTYEDGVREGRNQVLYLLLCLADENVVHDNWHPDRAQLLMEVRRDIVSRLRSSVPPCWPLDGWPDFMNYAYTPG